VSATPRSQGDVGVHEEKTIDGDTPKWRARVRERGRPTTEG